MTIGVGCRPAGRGSPTVLLTVSGDIPADLDEQVRRGDRPMADYRELAAAFGGADVLDRPAARRHAGRIGRLLERVAGPDVMMAWACRRIRDRYEVIVTDGEQIGLPYALLCRLSGRGRTAHVMIVHVLSTAAKAVPVRLLGLGRYVDRFVTYATAQSAFVRDALGVPTERIVQTPFMVDTRFFHPEVERRAHLPTICAVGLERRDYPTLIDAVHDLDVQVVIAAASPWSKQVDSSGGVPLPPNVQVCRLDPLELRQLYADSELLVMPLYEVDFQAGVTALLEAMAMGKPVVCSRTNGQTDVVEQDVTGLYVAPGDPAALRRAILRLLDDPALASQMGLSARRRAVEDHDVLRYAERLAAVVADAHGGAPARPHPVTTVAGPATEAAIAPSREVEVR